MATVSRRSTGGAMALGEARPEACRRPRLDVTFSYVIPDDTDIHGSPDATLGGYFRTHDRPPAFEGSDGHPYTVSIEVERTADLRAPWEGYLVYPRWARTGLGIEGHVETPTLWRGASKDAVLAEAGDTPLLEVQLLLDRAIAAATDPAN